MIRLAIVIFALLAIPAWAQSNCGVREKWIDIFKTKYNEQRVATGIAGQRALFELFVSPTGSWSLLVTEAGGRSCIVAGGTDWIGEPIKPEEKET